jgi:transposase
LPLLAAAALHRAMRRPKVTVVAIPGPWGSPWRHRHHVQSARPQGGRGPPGIETAGATLRYLPPYSPDFNPIENAFSKLKAILRKAAARTIPDLWDVIRDTLPQFTPQDCANYFTAAGYEPD